MKKVEDMCILDKDEVAQVSWISGPREQGIREL